MFHHKLETAALRKEYPGTVALQSISVEFAGGKIHAIIGKNGAGKSTLVKIFAGAVQPTSGKIAIDGRVVRFRSPREAWQHGIAAVHQELSLVPELTVAENILLGRFPGKPGLLRAVLDWSKVFVQAKEVLDRLGVNIDVHAKARSLGMAQQQLVEIAKAMSYNPSVLMLDEPTSALAHHETDRLFDLLRTLAASGVVILYITHRLQEIHRIADTVSVLRNGQLVGTIGVQDATPQRIVQMMFGETIRAVRPAEAGVQEDVVLQVQHLSRKNAFSDINFCVYRGEILGIAGLLGSGRTELLRAVFGADPPDEGHIIVDGKAIRPVSPVQTKRLGIALAPENRKDEGLVQILSTRANACMASLNRISFKGITGRLREQCVVERIVRTIGLTVPDAEAPVSSLSGGNQQKVVVGKWLNTDPKVILLDEPTRGIDVQAKQQMFQIMWDLSRRGISSVVVSTELEELLDICHRILVMRKGRIIDEVIPRETTLDKLFALCFEQ